MIDTLMVLWTKGIIRRFLRRACSFFLLLAGTCLLLFLLITGNRNWPGRVLAPAAPGFTKASVNSAIAPTPVPMPGARDISIPFILHNPTPAVIPINQDSGLHLLDKHATSLAQVERPHKIPGFNPDELGKQTLFFRVAKGELKWK